MSQKSISDIRNRKLRHKRTFFVPKIFHVFLNFSGKNGGVFILVFEVKQRGQFRPKAETRPPANENIFSENLKGELSLSGRYRPMNESQKNLSEFEFKMISNGRLE